MTDLDTLRARLSGQALRPGDPGFTDALEIDNGRVDLTPLLIVQPRSPADVALAMRYARDRQLPFTVKCGGHSAAGYSLNQGGLVLDMSLLKAMTLDREARVLQVEFGARWQDVYGYLLAGGSGLLPIGGGCLTVGLAGFVLGGGYSFASRSYGLSCDNLISLDLVTPDGELHHLHEGSESAEDRDLWWACRGGGGGNFGVAVRAELRLHQPPTERMMAAELIYPLTAAQDVIGAYNEWTQQLPNAMAAYGFLGGQPDPAEPSRNVNAFRVTAIFNGPFAEGMELLQPMLRQPVLHGTLDHLPLPVWENEFGKSTLVGDRQGYIRSGILPIGGMGSDVIDIYQRYIASSPSPDSFVVWTHAGGAVSDVAPDATAYVHREPAFVYELKSIWTDLAATRRNVEWAYGFGEELRPHFTGAYANYIDPLLTGWSQMYYGANYERLCQVKLSVDPDGIFGFQQGIGSDFQPSGAQPLDLSPLNRTIVPTEGS